MPGPGAVAPRSPIDPVPGQSSSTAMARPAAGDAAASLFTRLGGMDAIRGVVHDFAGRVGADERINAFFRGVDIPNFERLLSEQVCVASGGPCQYTGRSMRAAHEGMNLTDAHFSALVEDLVAALDHFNVPSREKGDLLSTLAALKPDIVGH
jgi:hemoglobin